MPATREINPLALKGYMFVQHITKSTTPYPEIIHSVMPPCQLDYQFDHTWLLQLLKQHGFLSVEELSFLYW